MRNWLVRPGWSTSWTAAATRAASISSLENTVWGGGRERGRERRYIVREVEDMHKPLKLGCFEVCNCGKSQSMTENVFTHSVT